MTQTTSYDNPATPVFNAKDLSEIPRGSPRMGSKAVMHPDSFIDFHAI